MCKRWAAVVNSPQLLQSLSLCLGGRNASNGRDAEATAAHLLPSRALLQWLLRWRSAGAVQQVDLQLQLGGLGTSSNAERTQMWRLAFGCLVVCAPQLHSLKVSPAGPLAQLSGVQQHMQQLHSLQLESDMYLRMLVSLGSLGSLRSLSIRVGSQSLLIGPGVALPPALTHLHLEAGSVQGAFNSVSRTSAGGV